MIWLLVTLLSGTPVEVQPYPSATECFQHSQPADGYHEEVSYCLEVTK